MSGCVIGRTAEGTDLRVVFACVSTTGLLAGSSGGDSLDSALQEVAELKSLDEVPICASYSSASHRGTALEVLLTNSRSCYGP